MVFNDGCSGVVNESISVFGIQSRRWRLKNFSSNSWQKQRGKHFLFSGPEIVAMPKFLVSVGFVWIYFNESKILVL